MKSLNIGFLIIMFLFVVACEKQRENVILKITKIKNFLSSGVTIESAYISDSGYIFVGGFQIGRKNKFFLAKFDTSGRLIWQKFYADIQNRGKNIIPYALKLTKEGNIILSGSLEDTNFLIENEAFLSKFDSIGNYEWTTILNYGVEDIRDFVVTDNGEIFAIGCLVNAYSGNRDIAFLKFDNNGKILDIMSWGGQYNDTPNKILQLPDGNLCVVGGVDEEEGTDIFKRAIFKLTPEGLILWSSISKSEFPSYYYDVVEIGGQSIIVVGKAEDFSCNSQSIVSIYVERMYFDGKTIWSKFVECNTIPYMVEKYNEKVIVCGLLDFTKVFLSAIDIKGKILWKGVLPSDENVGDLITLKIINREIYLVTRKILLKIHQPQSD